MSTKLKAFGLALFATLAMSAVAVNSASAETGGHFVTQVPHTLLVGSEGGNHTTELAAPTISESPIVCTTTSYHGTTPLGVTTTTEATITPTYSNCHTTSGLTVHVSMNGCAYVFTIRKTTPEKLHNTVHLECPAGKKVTLTVTTFGFSACHIEFGPQTPAGGAVYTTEGTNAENHALTVDVTAEKIAYNYTGLCGTGNAADGVLTGSVTLKGTDTEGKQKGITATGF